MQMAGVLGLDGRVEIHEEGEQIGREDEGDDPLEYRGGIIVSCEGA